MTVQQIIDALQALGVIGVLGVALVGGYRKWWVFGWLYIQKETEVEEWKEMALRGLTAADRAVTLGTKITEHPGG